MTEKKSFKFRIKEFFRKFLVSIKRNPQNVALVVLLVSFLTYSLNLTKFSNTTAYIQLTPMGLCQFVSMLFSILAMVCFLNAFPKRQKVRWVMLGIMFAMIAAIIAVDIVYYIKINQGVTDITGRYAAEAAGDTAVYNEKVAALYKDHPELLSTPKVLIAQIVLLGVSALLVALLPVYRPLLRKINTSIEVESNEDMGTIELESDAE